MPTFAQVIDEVIDKLQGFAATGDTLSWLAETIGAGDLTFTVGDASGLSQGIIEIEQELMWVASVDTTQNTVTVAPFGRGFRATTPAIHQVGTLIRMAPTWPRSAVAREINNVTQSLYPDLFAPKVQTFLSDATTSMYFLNPDGDFIVDLRWQFLPFDMQRARKWEVQQSFPDNRLWIYDDIPTGSFMEITYASAPAVLDVESTDWSVTGYGDTIKDLVVLGVVANMIQFKDVARVDILTAEADAMSTNRPPGAASNLANNYRQQFQQRLAQEVNAQFSKYPSHIHIVS